MIWIDVDVGTTRCSESATMAIGGSRPSMASKTWNLSSVRLLRLHKSTCNLHRSIVWSKNLWPIIRYFALQTKLWQKESTFGKTTARCRARPLCQFFSTFCDVKRKILLLRPSKETMKAAGNGAIVYLWISVEFHAHLPIERIPTVAGNRGPFVAEELRQTSPWRIFGLHLLVPRTEKWNPMNQQEWKTMPKWNGACWWFL